MDIIPDFEEEDQNCIDALCILENELKNSQNSKEQNVKETWLPQGWSWDSEKSEIQYEYSNNVLNKTFRLIGCWGTYNFSLSLGLLSDPIIESLTGKDSDYYWKSVSVETLANKSAEELVEPFRKLMIDMLNQLSENINEAFNQLTPEQIDEIKEKAYAQRKSDADAMPF